MGTKEHKKNTPENINIGVLSLSSTRTIENDEAGKWIKKRLNEKNHNVIFYEVIKDDIKKIRDRVDYYLNEKKPDVIILTGGTGISKKDVTIEAVKPIFEKELTGFGILFTHLSYEEIGSASVLSRATAGIVKESVIFCMPGSIKACKLAINKIILNELGHITKHIRDN